MESSACEKLCADCPRRNGVARFTGELVMWWAKKTLQTSRINRGECEGTVPKYAGAPNGTAFDIVTHESRRDELWMRACPVSVSGSAGRTATEQITKIFATNPHINVYVDRVIERLPQQEVEVEQQPQI